MEKLWTATVSVGLQVWAGSTEEAQHIARQFAGSEIVGGYGVVAVFQLYACRTNGATSCHTVAWWTRPARS